jgi:hypothetical protein
MGATPSRAQEVGGRGIPRSVVAQRTSRLARRLTPTVYLGGRRRGRKTAWKSASSSGSSNSRSDAAAPSLTEPTRSGGGMLPGIWGGGTFPGSDSGRRKRLSMFSRESGGSAMRNRSSAIGSTPACKRRRHLPSPV